MLTYLVKTTESLITLAAVLGLVFAFSKTVFSKYGRRITAAGALLGAAASIVMSYMKNATNKIDTGYWNLRIFIVSLAAFLVFLIFSAGIAVKITKNIGKALGWISLAVLAFTQIFYVMPDVWAYPYGFLTTDHTVLSTAFLYKFIGYILGLILVFLAGMAVFQTASRLSPRQTGLILKLALLLNAAKQVTSAISILLAKRLIVSNHTLFMIAKISSNNSRLFTYGTMLLAVILPIILWARSFAQREPYSNPAEHRKIRAKWRKSRKWASAAVITLALGLLNMTVVKAIDSKEVTLSPIEDAVTDDEAVYVSFDQVADGHLHRFAYTTENGTEIRFIVIKKPNSSSYGIGLDACDICGETGYYEKDGQVVCKLCDVVMNINTIGFKGGCNPIVIPYSISNGQIVVPIEGLLEYESEFK